MSKKPKGFVAFDALARKLVRVKLDEVDARCAKCGKTHFEGDCTAEPTYEDRHFTGLGKRKMKTRAWKTTLLGIVSAVAADSPAKAKAITLKSAHEASFHSAKYTDVMCQRWPEHDQWAEVASFVGPLDPKLLPK